MTPEEIAAIKARAEAASEGPWEAGDVWYTAGLIFNDKGERIGPRGATRCAYCHLGEPVEARRMNINGTKMRAHRHHVSDPYAPEHRISSADGGTVAGNYDYETGGILRAEDTAFIIAARTDVPALLAEIKELLADRDRARDAAVALEQENARLTERVTELEHTYLAYDTDDKGPVGMAEFLTDEERGL